MSGISCPECHQYFDDGEGHMSMHARQEQESDARYASAITTKQLDALKLSAGGLEENYMSGYTSEDEYIRDCRLTGFHQGMAAGIKGGPDTYPGDGYLMASEGVIVLQEGYEAGFAMGSRLRE